MADYETTEREDDSSHRQPLMRLGLRWVLPGQHGSVLFSDQPICIGRSEDCEVVLNQGRISRRHACVIKQGQMFALEDLSSTNGVFVDGQRVERGLLQDGTVVRIADWLGVVEAVQSSEAIAACEAADIGVLGGVVLRREVTRLLQVAPSGLPVVLQGETGTGKEVFARALHRNSRREGAFHALNCAALSPHLAEAELFGHRKGAFTGADRQHSGHLLAADRGTLFLDEVGELSEAAQAKLLRALETREVTAVGETRAVPFDARVVVATQTPLDELVRAGSFRRDLAMRISGVTIDLPSLTRRRGDIPQLFQHFLVESWRGPPPKLSPRLCERLCLRAWPGNVRELRLLAQRVTAFYPGAEDLGLKHLLDVDPTPLAGPSDSTQRDGVADADMELRRFTAALHKTRGNVQAAAKLAGVSRTRMYRLLRGRSPTELMSEPKMSDTHEPD